MESQSIEFQKASIVHDLQGLKQLKYSGRDDNPEALKIATQQFEALFMQMMLKSMRDSTKELAGEEGGFFSSPQLDMYEQMHDEQLASSMAEQGGFGLAQLMFEQLSPSTKTQQFKQSEQGILPVNITRKVLPKSVAKQNETVVATKIKSVNEPVANKVIEKATQPSAPSATQAKTNFLSPQDFVAKMYPYAKKAAALLNVSPFALIAQTALETGWGKHLMQKANGTSANNLFGIKADNRWQGEVAVKDTLEFREGVMVKEKHAFRAYKNFSDSFIDYAQFIKNGENYQQATQTAHHDEAYIKAIHQAGYATDPKYADKIITILNGDVMMKLKSDLIDGVKNSQDHADNSNDAELNGFKSDILTHSTTAPW